MKKITAFYMLSTFILLACQEQNSASMSAHFEIQGHRGSRGHLPENSIPGFILAIEQGVHTIELDLVVSKDSQLVVNHEPWLNPLLCLDPHGNNVTEKGRWNLFQMPMDSIRMCNCGSRPHPDFPEQKQMPVSRPALWEVVQVVEHMRTQHGDSMPMYNIELKYYPDELAPPSADTGAVKNTEDAFFPDAAQFAALVISEIRNLGIDERCSLQSFSAAMLETIHRQAPEITTVWLTEDNASVQEHLQGLSFVPSVYSPNFKTLTPEKITEAHALGMTVIPWTVNEERDMEQLMEWGVDGIITDYPDRLYKLFVEHYEGNVSR